MCECGWCVALSCAPSPPRATVATTYLPSAFSLLLSTSVCVCVCATLGCNVLGSKPGEVAEVAASLRPACFPSASCVCDQQGAVLVFVQLCIMCLFTLYVCHCCCQRRPSFAPALFLPAGCLSCCLPGGLPLPVYHHHPPCFEAAGVFLLPLYCVWPM